MFEFARLIKVPMMLEHKAQLDKIASEVDCPKNFSCYKSGTPQFCKTNEIGGHSLVACLEENGRNCKFALPFGYSLICKCPI